MADPTDQYPNDQYPTNGEGAGDPLVLDPVAEWAFVATAGGARNGDMTLRPVLLDLGEGTTLTRLQEQVTEVSESAQMVIPGVYRYGEVPVAEDPGERAVYSVDANAAFFRALRSLGAESQVTSAQHGFPWPPDALPSDAKGREEPLPRVELPDLPPKKGVVVTAVIDIGIPVLNAAFRDGLTSTRVRYAWIQDGVFTIPSFVPHGREFTKADLDALLVAHAGNGPEVDEVAAYREMGLMDFARSEGHTLGRRVTHGSHIGALAAGYAPEDARADRPVITVQIPQAVVRDTSGGNLEPALLAALDYIGDRTDRLSAEMNCGRLPLVINFSFGGTGGPLDGTSPLERAMDYFIRTRRVGGRETTQIVLPSGNGRLSQTHARYTADSGFPDGETTLDWRIQPDDFTVNIAEIWLPKGPQAQRLEVSLAPPSGSFTAPLAEVPGAPPVSIGPAGQVIAQLTYQYIGAPTNRGKFTAIVQATSNHEGQATAPAGTWKLRLRNTGLPAGSHIDAWVLRDDEFPGTDSDARQSRFTDRRCPSTDPRFQQRVACQQPNEPDCPIRPQGTQNVLGTGRRTVVIGGYVEKSGRMARYSSGGPTNTDDRPGPDASTVSDNSEVHAGVLSSATLSGGRVALNGTSVAAPQVSKALADRMADGKAAGREAVCDMAKATDPSAFLPDRVDTPPKARTGCGRIELYPQSRRRYWP